jgi:hypothetical protein
MHRGDVKATTDQANDENVKKLGEALDKIKGLFTVDPALRAAVKLGAPCNRKERRRAAALARRR